MNEKAPTDSQAIEPSGPALTVTTCPRRTLTVCVRHPVPHDWPSLVASNSIRDCGIIVDLDESTLTPTDEIIGRILNLAYEQDLDQVMIPVPRFSQVTGPTTPTLFGDIAKGTAGFLKQFPTAFTEIIFLFPPGWGNEQNELGEALGREVTAIYRRKAA